MKHLRCFNLVASLIFASAAAGVAEDAPGEGAGEKIYNSLCLKCHGMQGTGTSEHKKPLVGDLSVLELAKVIEQTMPEDDPGTCTGDDARRVAEFIHWAFYSPTAQDRIRPARIELSRLTVRQYQQTAADLIGGLHGFPVRAWGGERGLKASYFTGRGIDRSNRILERVDPLVQFDFGEGSPAEKIDIHEFSINWEGSLLPPETGDYEFILKTEHATRMWINDFQVPLIDAWVKSGNETEYRGTIRLLGGRVIPLRVQYSKAKQGVDDSKTNKPKPARSSMALWWKVPHHAAEVIPSRCLSTQEATKVFALETPFPPDDRSLGYERGTSVSKSWDHATTDAAIEIAEYIAERREGLAGVSDTASDRDSKLKTFCSRLAERAFRRPLTDEQKQLYVERHFSAGSPPEIAVKRSVLMVLKSPRFLYREPGTAPGDGFDVASRLSFILWDSLPDEVLVRAAAEGNLSTKEQVQAQAERMLRDPRARSKLREFFVQWLKVDRVHDLSKNSALFPDFTREIASDLRTSLDLFVEESVWGDRADFRRLLLAESIPLNGRLAKFYGVERPVDAPFTSITLDPGKRAGILTHPFLLSSFSYPAASSPIHRGVFVSRSLLGRVLKPPPEAVTPAPVELHPDLSTRERVAQQTKAQSCQACHGMINPLGFALENFDAAGRLRETEIGKPIDASGSYINRAGATVSFQGARELAAYLAGSEETHSAFVEQLFQYLVKQPIRAYGADRMEALKRSFAESEFDLRHLTASIATTAALAR